MVNQILHIYFWPTARRSRVGGYGLPVQNPSYIYVTICGSIEALSLLVENHLFYSISTWYTWPGVEAARPEQGRLLAPEGERRACLECAETDRRDNCRQSSCRADEACKDAWSARGQAARTTVGRVQVTRRDGCSGASRGSLQATNLRWRRRRLERVGLSLHSLRRRHRP